MWWFFVACLGAMGVLLRAGLNEWLSGPGFPWANLVANGIGSFCIGILYLQLNRVGAPSFASPAFTLALMVGLIGGLTTFSGFALDTVRLFEAGSYSLAAVYVLASNLICICACWGAVQMLRG